MRRSPIFAVAAKLASMAAGIILLIIVARWFFNDSPSERNRTRHPSGYSIIHPDGWTCELRRSGGPPAPGVTPTRDMIHMSPDRYEGIAPMMFVRRIMPGIDRDALIREGWTEGQFQNEPAMVLLRHAKKATMHEAIFERDGQWFEVGQYLQFAAQVRDPQLWVFLETFKYPDGPVPNDVAVAPTTNVRPTSEPFQF
ncbi:MAG: hypothetical protein JO353_12135 [Phycisphaerae bacterium]|nr:hypothetical protein [Phycisphaerae bacterium]